MKLDEKMCKLIGELEYVVGNQFYRVFDKETLEINHNEYDRIPICYPLANEYTQTVFNLAERKRMTEKLVNYMNYYVPPEGPYQGFEGRLLIGRGLKDVLDYLEERYGLDFNDLEEKCNLGFDDLNQKYD